jgi:hypothetical protein
VNADDGAGRDAQATESVASPHRGPLPGEEGNASATRHDLQLGRRAFHLGNGVAIASAYALLFTHEQVVHVFGAVACLVYIADRFRNAGRKPDQAYWGQLAELGCFGLSGPEDLGGAGGGEVLLRGGAERGQHADRRGRGQGVH